MFNEFRPKRPQVLTPDIWQSEAGNKAMDDGFDRYCEVYYSYLGDGYHSQHEAEKWAYSAGLHMAMICMACELEAQQRIKERNA